MSSVMAARIKQKRIAELISEGRRLDGRLSALRAQLACA